MAAAADLSLRELPTDLPEQVARALSEDIGTGDVTAALIGATQSLRARVISREPAVLCGCAWFSETLHQLDPTVQVRWHSPDGAQLVANAVVCDIAGPARSILTGERTALNFLQLLSGTATITARYVAAVAGTGCRILDTRKTLPGLRTAQKFAVRCGGGSNHRFGLFDQVLIKENHIAAAGSIAAAVARARQLTPTLKIEVETEDLDELDQALAAAADIIMLDEYSLADMQTAVARNRASPNPALLEVSGSVTLESIREFAMTGVDCISIGALTKHVRAIDLSMRVVD